MEQSVFERGEQHPEILARSFEEAEALRRGFSDDVVLAMLYNRLGSPDGSRFIDLKESLDSVELDDSDEKILNAESVVKVHSDVAQMISENLRIAINTGEVDADTIEQKKREYIQRLNDGSASMGRIVGDVINQQTIGDEGVRALGYEYGLQRLPGTRENIRIQDQLTDAFILWDSDACIKAKLSGEDTKFERRIYLNPKTQSLVSTFSRLVTELNAKGIVATAKMFDRSLEMLRGITNADKPVRADAIVMYLMEKDANEVLDLVLSIYEEDPSVFENRATPKIPSKIAPGIAVGDEGVDPTKSLTSHREELIGRTINETREMLGMPVLSGNVRPEVPSDQAQREMAINTFRKTFVEIAKEMGVNPDNLAFDTRDEENA